MEQKVLLVLKGILLYTTIILAILWVSAIDSLYDNGYFFPSTLIVASLIYTCYKIINEEEFNILCLSKYFGDYDEDKDDMA